MKEYGTHYCKDSLREILEKENSLYEPSKEEREVKEVLHKFHQGYTLRQVEKVNDFVDELFIAGEDTCILGTGTEELFLGIDRVKTLIRDDWKYWGDVNLDWENSHIFIDGEVASFVTAGSVKYTFEDTRSRYESYVNFIKSKAEEEGLPAKQKITFINWILALTYHQREEKRREYLWPLCLSGVLLKEKGKWKFTHLHFSIPRGNFPDERFENSKEHIEGYIKQNALLSEYKSNKLTPELEALMVSLKNEFLSKKHISNEFIRKYFDVDSSPYIIGAKNQWHCGIDDLKEFFNGCNEFSLSLDLNHALSSNAYGAAWITASGILKRNLTEDQLAEGALEELNNIFQGELSSKEKLFAAQRSVSYAIKESASGSSFTCPVRCTALVLNSSKGPVFHHIHFSFPSYWILEGKL